MIITCANCGTQFAVPSSAIPPEGRRVKCSACGNVWHQDPLERLVEEKTLRALAAESSPREQPEPIKAGSNLPAVKKERKVKGWMKALFWAGLLVIAMTAPLVHHEKLTSLRDVYHAIGLRSTDGLVFSQMEVERVSSGGMLELAIKGKVNNESSDVMFVPDVVITLLSEGDREMGKLVYPIDVDVLGPGESASINPEITNVDAAAAKLTLDIGNRWELFFR